MTEKEKPKVQVLRYSDSELKLMNDTFSERHDLLMLLRRFFLQGLMSKGERENVKFFANPNLITIMRKTYYPEIDLNTPIGQIVDLWSNVDTKNKGVEDACLEMAMREKLIKYVKDRFTDLINDTDGGLRLSDLEYDSSRPDRENFVNIGARNMIIAHIDFQTGQIWILAGQKLESVVEIQKRLFRQSGK